MSTFNSASSVNLLRYGPHHRSKHKSRVRCGFLLAVLATSASLLLTPARVLPISASALLIRNSSSENENSQAKNSPPVIPKSNETLLELLNNYAVAHQLPAPKLIPDSSNDVGLILSGERYFTSGVSELSSSMKETLASLAKWMASQPTISEVTIESHTDSSPIYKSRNRYKSNWDLSAARSATLARLFEDAHFPKKNLRAVAFSDSRPAEGSQQSDRRILIRIRGVHATH